MYRRQINARSEEWELVGTTPLEPVRFIRGAGYYLRFEADGHRKVELLQSAVVRKPTLPPPVEIVKLDPESVLPATMVRIPGFTEEGFKYTD